MVVTRGDNALARRRSDDLNDGDSRVNPVALPGIRKRRRRGGIAGDNESLHAARGQLVESGQRQRAHLRNCARTIGRMLGVAQVDNLFVGQFIDDCTSHRQPT